MDTGSAYTQAVDSGQYEKDSGLIKKYDNVRVYWEDETTRIFLRPHIERLMARKEERLERFRILDLGCGSGDGLELLRGVRRKDNDLTTQEIHAISEENLGSYLGIDNNPALMQQAEEIHGGNTKIAFSEGDFSDLTQIVKGQKAFDLFFSSYGTMSHCDDEQLIDLMRQIMDVSGDYAIIVCDWLGRFVYSWQEVWTNDSEKAQVLDYRISYIYSDDVRDNMEIESFPLRLMSREEVKRLTDRFNRIGKKKVRLLNLADRSIFVSRHMDTRDYNRMAQPIRRRVNSLHEDFMRTQLEELLIDYHPKPGFEEINAYLEKLHVCWNTLVKYTMFLLENYDRSTETFHEDWGMNGDYPAPLKKGMIEMKKVVQGTGWIQTGDVRANMIEPQLGYSLRQLEVEMQKGLGVGHGLMAILEIQK